MPVEPEIATIVQQLSRYLRGHPQASDTAEGIARWWGAGHGRASPAAVEAALDWMVTIGVVEVVDAADGRVRYRRRTDVADIDDRLDAIVLDPAGAPVTTGPSSAPRSN
jgi:hypothetical protein